MSSPSVDSTSPSLGTSRSPEAEQQSGRSASCTSSDQAARSAQPELPVDAPTGATLVPISGNGNRCFYLATARARQMTEVQLQQQIRDATESITDATVLFRYGFNVGPQDGQQKVADAKKEYLESHNFTTIQWGGSREMQLLSHAAGGQLRFLVVSKGVELPFLYYSSVHLDSPTTTQEIALYHCAYRGDESIKNHYNAFDYQIGQSGVTSPILSIRADTAAQREHRQQLLLKAAFIVVPPTGNRILHRGAPIEDLSEAVEHDPSSATALPLSGDTPIDVASSEAAPASASASAPMVVAGDEQPSTDEEMKDMSSSLGGGNGASQPSKSSEDVHHEQAKRDAPTKALHAPHDSSLAREIAQLNGEDGVAGSPASSPARDPGAATPSALDTPAASERASRIDDDGDVIMKDVEPPPATSVSALPPPLASDATTAGAAGPTVSRTAGADADDPMVCNVPAVPSVPVSAVPLASSASTASSASALRAPSAPAPQASSAMDIPEHPLPETKVLRPRSVQVKDKALEQYLTLEYARDRIESLPLKDFQMIVYNTSPDQADLYLEMVSPTKESSFKIQMPHRRAFDQVVEKLAALVANDEFEGDFFLVDMSTEASVKLNEKAWAASKKIRKRSAPTFPSAAESYAALAAEGAVFDEKEYEWECFKGVDPARNTVEVKWKNGDVSSEPMDGFIEQIGLVLFAFHHKLLTLPWKQRQDMQARMAKGASRGRRGRRSAKRQKTTAAEVEEYTESVAPPTLQQQLDDASSHLSVSTCSFCGSVATLCTKCACSECSKQVCSHCFSSALDALPVDAPRSEHYRCAAHGGLVDIPTHPTVEVRGLPDPAAKSVGVYTAAGNYPAYADRLEHPSISCAGLPAFTSRSRGKTSAASSRHNAVILEYHTMASNGNVLEGGQEVAQTAFLSRYLPAAAAAAMPSSGAPSANAPTYCALLTCGGYRHQLDQLVAYSAHCAPHVVFLLFRIDQLFVPEVQSAVCSTIRHCLLYPQSNPLAVAKEYFGQQITQTHRPYFLYRGREMPIVHHTSDLRRPCRCGVMLKNAGYVHRRTGDGWRAFEPFQVEEYRCKKGNRLCPSLLLARV